MSIRYLADENVDLNIIKGLLAREPAIDILDVKTAGLRGQSDPVLLELAAQQGRILTTYDRQTMTRFFRERLERGGQIPGVFILRQDESASARSSNGCFWCGLSPKPKSGGTRSSMYLYVSF